MLGFKTATEVKEEIYQTLNERRMVYDKENNKLGLSTSDYATNKCVLTSSVTVLGNVGSIIKLKGFNLTDQSPTTFV